MTKARLLELAARFPKTRVLVLGDLILDEFIWGAVDRISPEAPVPVVRMERESHMPGGAANVASNIRALGGEPILIGVVGRDQAGSRLREALESRKISTQRLLTDPTRPTTTKTRVVAHHQQVVRIDREKAAPFSAPIRKRLVAAAQEALRESAAVIIEDYGKGLIAPEILKPILLSARRQRKVITVDPKEEHFRFYRGVSALTPNKKEASLAAGVSITDKKSLHEAGRQILKTLKPEVLLVTLGEEGMCLFSGNGAKPLHISTVAQEVFDVSGAGDTVVAAFTLAKAAGGSYPEAAAIANAAAGVVVGKVGTATCSVDELMRQMLEPRTSSPKPRP